MFFNIIEQIISFTWDVLNTPISGAGISFTLWDVIAFSVIGFLIFFFIFKILLFFDNAREI